MLCESLIDPKIPILQIQVFFESIIMPQMLLKSIQSCLSAKPLSTY